MLVLGNWTVNEACTEIKNSCAITENEETEAENQNTKQND